MLHVGYVALCALVPFAFASGTAQAVPTEDQEKCASGYCPRRGAAMLQKERSQPTRDSIQDWPYIVTANKRCHPTGRNGAWGDLGKKDLTDDECQDKCSSEETCMFATREASGRCTSFHSCAITQEREGTNTYEKTFGPITPAPPASCETSCLADSSNTDLRPRNPTGPIFMTRERLCALRCSDTEVATRKRGLGMRPGEEAVQCTDASALGLDDSWFYSWGAEDSAPAQGETNSHCASETTRTAREFVPMVINCDTVDQIWNNIHVYKPAWEALGAKFLMGYNEPDGSHHTCPPKLGAEKWVTVQKIADAFDPPLRLVSPSPCSGNGKSCAGGGIAYGDSPWLTGFFEACSEIPECNPDSVEFIGMHDYEGDFETRPDHFPLRVENLAKNYRFANGMKRQIWITETNVGCGQTSLCRDNAYNKPLKIYRNGKTSWPSSPDDSITQEEHLGYMKKLIPYLENSEDIFRYTWFGIRKMASMTGYPNLLPHSDPEDDTPTLLGKYYMTAEGGR